MEINMEILNMIYDTVKDINAKVDKAIASQSNVNNEFYECRGRGKNTNKLVFIILSLLLTSQFVVGYFAYPRDTGTVNKVPSIETKKDTSEVTEPIFRDRQNKAFIKTAQKVQ